MQNLTRAHEELFRRAPDERFGSLIDLWQHCQEDKERSVDRWHAPEAIKVEPAAGRLRLALGQDGVFDMNDWSFAQLCRLARVTKDTPSTSLGFKGDFFSEILHVLRSDMNYGEYVQQEMQLVNCKDLRDRKAITRLASGFLKLLFPDLKPTREEFTEYCVRPAVALRQRVRDELHKMDPEYEKVEIGVA